MNIDKIIEAQEHQAVADIDGRNSKRSVDWLYDFFLNHGAEVLELCYKELRRQANDSTKSTSHE